MPRSVQEIADDLRQAVTTMAATNLKVAQTLAGASFVPPPGGTPTIEVQLPDGRTVELGALADELLEASR